MDLLRLITAGNVDDGKSTLVGRMLHDSHSLMEDQLDSIQDASDRRGDGFLNLALVTDGLRAEREQGITIDVAYRYFMTPRRKFILADCPGHTQYTRNMVTGASSANLAILMVDARKGLVEQTRRHSFIISLLRIPHLVICVNKMDLVDYSAQRFEEIRKEFAEFSKKLEIHDVTFIPMSALHGENVVTSSVNMPWYRGRPMLEHLEEVHIASDLNLIDFRFPVQTVMSPQGGGNGRSYAGAVASGSIRRGDPIVVLPSGFKSTVKSIQVSGQEVPEVSAPLSAMIALENEIDISRGDLLARPNNQPISTQDHEALICWLDQSPFRSHRKYMIRHTTAEGLVAIQEVLFKIDINTLGRVPADSVVANDFARIRFRSSRPLLVDPFTKNRATGSFILIDLETSATVAAGMLL